MSILAGTLIEIASLLATIIIVLSIALFGSISIRNKQVPEEWSDDLRRVDQRYREAGE